MGTRAPNYDHHKNTGNVCIAIDSAGDDESEQSIYQYERATPTVRCRRRLVTADQRSVHANRREKICGGLSA